MSRFTEDEVRQVHKMAETENRFSPTTDRSCNGTLFSIDRMETKGVKLVVTPIGIKYEIKATNVSDFVDSPCVWIGENGQGRWAGLQGGWPTDKEEQEEELAYDSAVIRRDRNRYPNPDIDRPVEFMNLERGKRSYVTPKPGWLNRAERRVSLYKELRSHMPESLAAKVAKDVDFESGKPQLYRLGSSYVWNSLRFLLKFTIFTAGIVKVIELL